MEAKKSNKKRSDNNNEDGVHILVGRTLEQDEPKVHNLTCLESFSKSSESLKMPVSKIEGRKKSRSSSRKLDSKYESTVSRDEGESYLTNVMKNISITSSETNISDEKLRLQNIRLESKVDRLERENMEILHERNELKTYGEKLEREMSNKLDNYSNIESKLVELSDNNHNKSYELQEAQYKLQTLINDLQNKSTEIEQQNNEITALKESMDSLRQNNLTFSLDCDEKSTVISDLKKKITEINSQLELTKIFRENSEYQVEHLKSEIERLKSIREATNEQLKSMEVARDKLQDEIFQLTASLKEITCDKEQIKQENVDLRFKIKKMHEQKLQEWSKLLKDLEESQKDINWLIEDKENLENKINLIQENIEEKTKMLDDERIKNSQLQSQIRDLNEELVESNNSLLRAEENCKNQVEHSAVLRGQLNNTEADLASKIEIIKQYEAEKNDIQQRIEYLTQNISNKDENLIKINEELNQMQCAYDRVVLERNEALIGIENMRKEIDEVETSFETTRQDLLSKEQALKLTEELTDTLKNEFEKERENLEAKERIINELLIEKQNFIETLENLQKNHHGILEEVDSLRSCLSLANHKIVEFEELLEKEKKDNIELKDENEHIKKELNDLKQQLIATNDQLTEFSEYKDKYTNLLTNFEQIKNDYFELTGENDLLKREYEDKTCELTNTKMELAKLVSEKEEIVQKTQQNLETIQAKSTKLNNEIENLKFNHTIELAKKDEQFSTELEKSRKDFSEMCQEKIRCESAIENLKQHINKLNNDYEEKLNKCNIKMLTLQQQSTEYAELENQTLQLKDELAKKKGEFEAILESWQKFKQHVRMLEENLSKKHGEIVDLESEKDLLIKDYKNQLNDIDTENNYLRKTIKDQENYRNTIENKSFNQEMTINKLNEQIKLCKIEQKEIDNKQKCLQDKIQYLLDENSNLKQSEQDLVESLQKRYEENQVLQKNNNNLKDKLNKSENEKSLESYSLKSLLDEVEQRKKMLENSQIERKLNDEIHAKEIRQMKQFLQDIRDDRDKLSRHIELKSQQEIVASAVLARLRNQVSSILYMNDIQNEPVQYDAKSASYAISKEQLSELKKLLLDTDMEINMGNKKPLSKLSNCIEDLRSQIDSLQSEIAIEIDNQ